MTREEAIAILDPETSRDALWTYELEDRLKACNEACRVAVTALRSQQEPAKLDRSQWEGCEYCTGDTPKGVVEIKIPDKIRISESDIRLEWVDAL